MFFSSILILDCVSEPKAAKNFEFHTFVECRKVKFIHLSLVVPQQLHISLEVNWSPNPNEYSEFPENLWR
jgi:hypothetical protein